MKLLIALVLMSFISCMDNPTFTLLHYNVKELSATKLLDPENKQATELIKFLNSQEFDILSINELRYDPTVMQILNTKLETKKFKGEVFIKANTGNKSRPNTPDIVNYGRVPGEYSNGALTKFKILNEVIIQDLKWSDFFKEEDFSSYKLSNNEAIPKEIELFDKSFSDTTLLIEDVQVHLVLLHTVPAYGFGNANSINFLRNQRQLEFLKWYLNLDGLSNNKANMKPLSKGSSFIVVGDLNVDYKANTLGAKVLNSIIKNSNTWLPKSKMDFTHPEPKLMLDYIITSKNINATDAKIYKDASNVISDHLPIWGKFEIN